MMPEQAITETISCFQQLMPNKFTGSDVVQYLSEFNEVCDILEITDKRKIQLFLIISESQISKQLRTLNCFKIKSLATPLWTDAEKAILEEFQQDEDLPTLNDLEIAYNPSISLAHYIRNYEAVANNIDSKIGIPKHYKRNYFILNLPKEMRDSISQKLTATSTYEEVKDWVLKLNTGHSRVRGDEKHQMV
ncbi:hypothetical protein K7432_018559 [Basidiobolus ranarum]|uniref:Uncharacterized protein n=1 Tax=Basidiobolus ranarum TaxID=34480 RepID=A0ABR2WC20_9FUNG